ncbi:hypothetical protein [Pedobacter roseus]|uniref:DUF4238 domain-containing protein n=1 Tax=Pedobacter roseus TaxID=336820 RepID=A0A7G9QMA9_9SPHI|nr:hypothetical protein [Pedobacter roseus]QNN44484.1 hypothetical protein H9L23_10595 [Pedobacter roseus]
MKNGICKLCLEEKPLIGKSHIYPQFLYQGVFDETNRTVLQYLKNDGHQFFQTGFYDKYILCECCDNVILGSLERYAALVFYNPHTTNSVSITETRERKDLTVMNVQNIDYKKFKLFVLSLLWRAHISTNGFFKEVDVSQIEPQLRSMLFNNELANDKDFQLSITRIDRPNGAAIDIIPNPKVNFKQKLKVAIFIIGGLVYAIELERDSGFSFFPDFSLKPTNEILIPRLSHGTARAYLKALGIPDKHANYFSGTKQSSI